MNLRRLVNLIDETEWTALDVDVKAEAFEGLLEKAASEGKKGAGQYFTPRLLIQAIVRCMKPDPRTAAAFTIMDPACGTGGFLVAAYEWLKRETGGGAFSREITGRIRRATYFGQELVARPRRLALMHLYLHGLEPEIAYCWTISEWHHLPGTLRNERREIPIPLPPLAEQRRIVAQVELLLARTSTARDRLARVPAILRRFRQCVLAAASDGRLTADWRDAHAEGGTGQKLLESLLVQRRVKWKGRYVMANVPQPFIFTIHADGRLQQTHPKV